MNQDKIASAIETLANTITPFRESVYSDHEIGAVGCVVESQIAIAKGLFAIATAITELTQTIQEKQ